jgi:hypothetical protein
MDLEAEEAFKLFDDMAAQQQWSNRVGIWGGLDHHALSQDRYIAEDN